jgi:tRNA threonylcarbamoyladenosine biosynthesis protein TsaE
MREPGELRLELGDEAATRAAGAALAAALAAAGAREAMVTLAGELGVGKTTLVRGFLEALGVAGAVRSPTYTLVESYRLGERAVHHLDWYRLSASADLEALGFRDLLGPGQWVLIEWPERAPNVASQADIAVALGYRSIGRHASITGLTATGRDAVARLRTANA